MLYYHLHIFPLVEQSIVIVVVYNLDEIVRGKRFSFVSLKVEKTKQRGLLNVLTSVEHRGILNVRKMSEGKALFICPSSFYAQR